MTAREILRREREAESEKFYNDVEFLTKMRRTAERNRLDQIELGDGDGNEQLNPTTKKSREAQGKAEDGDSGSIW